MVVIDDDKVYLDVCIRAVVVDAERGEIKSQQHIKNKRATYTPPLFAEKKIPIKS